MIEIQSAGLEGVASFKKSAEVILNKNPLTFVRGVNRDSDPATPTGNGAGKSLLFSIVPTVAYAAPPTSKKKKSKKEVLGKKSRMFFKMKGGDGNVYDINQTSTKYKIEKNGVDTEMRTVPLAEEHIRTKLFPLSEIEYYSHGYVSTLRPYLMHSDTDSNRLEHISSIFRLEDYADMRAYFATKLRSVKDDEVRIAVLEQKLLTLKEKIKRVKKLLKGSTLAVQRKENKALEVQIEHLVAKEFELLKTKQVLVSLQAVEKELDGLRAAYKSKKAPKEYLAWLKTQKALVKTVEEYKKLHKAYKRNTASIQEKIDELKLPKKDAEALKTERKKNQKLREKIEPELEQLEEQRKAHKKMTERLAGIQEQLDGYGKEVLEVDPKADYTSEIESHKVSLRLQSLLEHDHDEDDNKCPTCMSEIDIANIRKVVKRAKAALPVLKRRVEIQNLSKELVTARKEARSISYNKARHDEVKLSITICDELDETVEKDLRAWKKLADLKETLAEIKAPKKPKEDPDTDMSYDEIDEKMDECNAILSAVASKNKLLENNENISDCRTVKAVMARIDEVDKQLTAVNKELAAKRVRSAELSESIEKYSNYESEHSLYLEDLHLTEVAILEIKPETNDKKVLETLIKAYSTKGLKTVVANRICTVLEANLNLYRSLIFVEPFTFTVKANETGMSIIVDRGNDIGPTDVRSLSGAESNCFCLLFLLSLLPLIPASRRLSMVTLDEPMAHCDSVTRQLFLESYLPALCEVVPHVYVITNNPDDHCVGSNEWIVVKHKGKSRVITNQ